MRNLCILSVLFLFIALGEGCGGHKSIIPGIDERNIKMPPLPPRDSINNLAYQYFSEGTIYEALGDIASANNRYGEALKYYPGSAEIRYSYATTFFQLGNYRRALSEVVDLHPRNLQIWLLMADCYRALGVIDSARAGYREAVRVDSNAVGAYHYLAAYYQQNNQLDSTIWAYENIARLSPGYRVYQEIGNLQMRTNRLAESEKSYLQSLALDSSENNVRSILGLSVLFENRGDRERAKQYLEKAAHLTPNNVLIQSRLMGFYQEDNQTDKALGVAAILKTLAPTDRALIRQIGILYFNADSLLTADSIMTSLINDGDTNIVNYYYAGRIAMMLKDYKRAQNDFLRVTVLVDSVVDGWLNLGLVYQMQDSVERELATYREAIKHVRGVEDTVRINFVTAAAYEKKGEIDSAVAIFERILKIRPDHSQSLNYLGYMLADRGIRLDYALDLIKKAVSLSPDNGAYLDSYGWVLYHRGDYKGALEQALLAYKFINNDAVIMEHLGDIYTALNDRVRAGEFYRKALQLDPDNKELKKKLGR